MYLEDKADMYEEFELSLSFWHDLDDNVRKWIFRDAVSRYNKWGSWENVREFVENYVKVVEYGSERTISVVSTNNIQHWTAWGEMLEKLSVG